MKKLIAVMISSTLMLGMMGAHAEDTMKKPMAKKDTMGMSKDSMSKTDTKMSKDHMSKDSMAKDKMKKDEMMKKKSAMSQ
ncbi:pentapeptide MXKDX repeat protein [Serratia sp. M24T3]|uniref:Pentapeptide MXKDX repeat protein n=1 Tax=Rouxiella sp. WC2420 TaxID=3234145 RepID=A0AB39VTF4_9GAMM|nr:pentapeptide MXKDX repeat protein [Serratia sp. M24T3]EIC84577.1 pentapeptide MXKDX repeat-containing protein [Serratia sp. M24T3]